MTTDTELLRSYARERSEGAFAELVNRRIDLVYSAALRETGGDAPLAEDITQAVFAELARKAVKLAGHPALAGWLYTCVRRMTANVQRSEARRSRRELEAQIMTDPASSDSLWPQIRPVLDEAMHELNEKDRAAVVLRFFEDRSHKKVGLALGLNENAARMRVERAMEKLRVALERRGVTSTAAGLTVALTTSAVVSAPTELAASVAAGALAHAAASATSTFAAVKLMTLTKLKLSLIAGSVVAAGLATSVLVEHRSREALHSENEALQQRFDQLVSQTSQLSNLLARAESSQAMSRTQLNELLKLRGEVGGLRRQLADAQEAQRRTWAAVAPLETSPPQANAAAEEQKQQSIAKMHYLTVLVMGLTLCADANQGQLPTDLSRALSFSPEEEKEKLKSLGNSGSNSPATALSHEQFELTYQGSLKAITQPATIIVVREKQAWSAVDGGWNRAYGFTDGHSEIHHSADGNYDSWEQQHMMPLAAQ